MNERQWRETVKEGDSCLIVGGSFGTRITVDVVAATTKTQITTKHHGKFMRRTGKQLGKAKTWRGPTISPYDASVVEASKQEITERRNLNELRELVAGKLTATQVTAMLAAHKAAPQEKDDDD